MAGRVEREVERAHERLANLSGVIPTVNVAIGVRDAERSLQGLGSLALEIDHAHQTPQMLLELFQRFSPSNFEGMPSALALYNQIKQELEGGRIPPRELLERFASGVLVLSRGERPTAELFFKEGTLPLALFYLSSRDERFVQLWKEEGRESAQRYAAAQAVRDGWQMLGGVRGQREAQQVNRENYRDSAKKLVRRFFRLAGIPRAERGELEEKALQLLERSPLAFRKSLTYLLLSYRLRRFSRELGREFADLRRRVARLRGALREGFRKEISGEEGGLSGIREQIAEVRSDYLAALTAKEVEKRASYWEKVAEAAEDLGMAREAERLRALASRLKRIRNPRQYERFLRQHGDEVSRIVDRVEREARQRVEEKVYQQVSFFAEYAQGVLHRAYWGEEARAFSRSMRQHFDRFRRGELSLKDLREVMEREAERVRAVRAVLYLRGFAGNLRRDFGAAQQAHYELNAALRLLREGKVSAAFSKYRHAASLLGAVVRETCREAIGEPLQTEGRPRPTASSTAASLFRGAAEDLWRGRHLRRADVRLQHLFSLTLSLKDVSEKLVAGAVRNYADETVRLIRVLRTSWNNRAALNGAVQDFGDAIRNAQWIDLGSKIAAGLALALVPGAGEVLSAAYFASWSAHDAWESYERTGQLSEEALLFLAVDLLPLARIGTGALRVAARGRRVLGQVERGLEIAEKLSNIGMAGIGVGSAAYFIAQRQLLGAALTGLPSSMAFFEILAVARAARGAIARRMARRMERGGVEEAAKVGRAVEEEAGRVGREVSQQPLPSAMRREEGAVPSVRMREQAEEEVVIPLVRRRSERRVLEMSAEEFNREAEKALRRLLNFRPEGYREVWEHFSSDSKKEILDRFKQLLTAYEEGKISFSEVAVFFADTISRHLRATKTLATTLFQSRRVPVSPLSLLPAKRLILYLAADYYLNVDRAVRAFTQRGRRELAYGRDLYLGMVNLDLVRMNFLNALSLSSQRIAGDLNLYEYVHWLSSSTYSLNEKLLERVKALEQQGIEVGPVRIVSAVFGESSDEAGFLILARTERGFEEGLKVLEEAIMEYNSSLGNLGRRIPDDSPLKPYLSYLMRRGRMRVGCARGVYRWGENIDQFIRRLREGADAAEGYVFRSSEGERGLQVVEVGARRARTPFSLLDEGVRGRLAEEVERSALFSPETLSSSQRALENLLSEEGREVALVHASLEVSDEQLRRMLVQRALEEGKMIANAEQGAFTLSIANLVDHNVGDDYILLFRAAAVRTLDRLRQEVGEGVRMLEADRGTYIFAVEPPSPAAQRFINRRAGQIFQEELSTILRREGATPRFAPSVRYTALEGGEGALGRMRDWINFAKLNLLTRGEIAMEGVPANFSAQARALDKFAAIFGIYARGKAEGAFQDALLENRFLNALFEEGGKNHLPSFLSFLRDNNYAIRDWNDFQYFLSKWGEEAGRREVARKVAETVRGERAFFGRSFIWFFDNVYRDLNALDAQVNVFELHFRESWHVYVRESQQPLRERRISVFREFRNYVRQYLERGNMLPRDPRQLREKLRELFNEWNPSQGQKSEEWFKELETAINFSPNAVRVLFGALRPSVGVDVATREKLRHLIQFLGRRERRELRMVAASLDERTSQYVLAVREGDSLRVVRLPSSAVDALPAYSPNARSRFEEEAQKLENNLRGALAPSRARVAGDAEALEWLLTFSQSVTHISPELARIAGVEQMRSVRLAQALLDLKRHSHLPAFLEEAVRSLRSVDDYEGALKVAEDILSLFGSTRREQFLSLFPHLRRAGLQDLEEMAGIFRRIESEIPARRQREFISFLQRLLDKRPSLVFVRDHLESVLFLFKNARNADVELFFNVWERSSRLTNYNLSLREDLFSRAGLSLMRDVLANLEKTDISIDIEKLASQFSSTYDFYLFASNFHTLIDSIRNFSSLSAEGVAFAEKLAFALSSANRPLPSTRTLRVLLTPVNSLTRHLDREMMALLNRVVERERLPRAVAERIVSDLGNSSKGLGDFTPFYLLHVYENLDVAKQLASKHTVLPLSLLISLRNLGLSLPKKTGRLVLSAGDYSTLLLFSAFLRDERVAREVRGAVEQLMRKKGYAGLLEGAHLIMLAHNLGVNFNEALSQQGPLLLNLAKAATSQLLDSQTAQKITEQNLNVVLPLLTHISAIRLMRAAGGEVEIPSSLLLALRSASSQTDNQLLYIVFGESLSAVENKALKLLKEYLNNNFENYRNAGFVEEVGNRAVAQRWLRDSSWQEGALRVRESSSLQDFLWVGRDPQYNCQDFRSVRLFAATLLSHASLPWVKIVEAEYKGARIKFFVMLVRERGRLALLHHVPLNPPSVSDELASKIQQQALALLAQKYNLPVLSRLRSPSEALFDLRGNPYIYLSSNRELILGIFNTGLSSSQALGR